MCVAVCLLVGVGLRVARWNCSTKRERVGWSQFSHIWSMMARSSVTLRRGFSSCTFSQTSARKRKKGVSGRSGCTSPAPLFFTICIQCLPPCLATENPALYRNGPGAVGEWGLGVVIGHKNNRVIIILFLVDSMESVDTLPRPFPLQSATTQAPLALPKRSLSPAEEKEALMRKIEALVSSNQALEERQSTLQGTIYDLRKLLTVVGRESAEEVEHLHRKNQQLKDQAGRLASGLKYAYQNGKHLHHCAQYWQEFLQQ